jgi:hypothetical protein
VLVRSDSLLLVQQMRGVFKVKNPGLLPLHATARLLAHDIGKVIFEHVGRALNAHADRLANAAMDGETKSEGGSLKSEQTSEQKPKDLLTSLERAVRLFVYRHFIDTTRAPDVATLADAVKAKSDAVIAALKRLADLHALVLAPATTSIWMAHPFSAVPTAYPVAIGGRTYWANCAWDAAGVLSLVGGNGESGTRCADCGEEVAMVVRDGRMHGDGVVHYAVPPRRFWENVAYT